MLTLLRAGMATSVQDAGRFSYGQSGVSLSGVLDLPAMKTANLLVGNPESSAVLEITFGQCRFRFERDSWFALTGAGCQAELDGETVWTGWRTFARAGQVLTLTRAIRGVRSYLAINGGFDLPQVMDSCSTDLKAGFGGWQGRYLKDGDSLPLHPATRRFSASVGVRQLLWGNRVRVIPGPEYHEFSAESQQAFWRTGWVLSTQSNRMGYRLQGRQLHRPDGRELLSHAVLPGTIQVTNGGQPVVLMADAQTTGGYPRIGSVIASDLYHLAQIRPGEPIHFVHCTLQQAREAKQHQQHVLDMMKWGLSES